jgi:hypothetical protein
MSYLYRGVSAEFFKNIGGKLSPKIMNEEFSEFAQFGGESVSYGSGNVFGKSNVNAVIKHQYQQRGIPTSGVSSSPFIERARYYACSGGKNEKRYIFIMSIESLSIHGVSIYRVNDLVRAPALYEDDEHVLVANDFGVIPESAIIEIIEYTNGA